ncbi:MAG: hypothetical protein IKW70_00150 [Verrucomicrobia bacterium]|nr:hypothetical protein [Verrucomicrobiota bacterium]
MPVPDPITRQEQFLNAAATGDTSNLPDPITREEVYLDAIARNGSGGGGGGSPAPDMVILTTDYDGMWGKATYTVLSGTYAALKSKVQSRVASLVELFAEKEEDPSQGLMGQKSFYAATEVALFSSGGTEFIVLGFCESDGGAFSIYAYPDNTVTGEWPFGD